MRSALPVRQSGMPWPFGRTQFSMAVVMLAPFVQSVGKRRSLSGFSVYATVLLKSLFSSRFTRFGTPPASSCGAANRRCDQWLPLILNTMLLTPVLNDTFFVFRFILIIFILEPFVLFTCAKEITPELQALFK